MNVSARQPRFAMILSAAIALVLQVMPLPNWLDLVRPALLVLAVLYWSLNAPRAGGLMLAFVAGLCIDVFKGATLGQYALATTLVAYVAMRQLLLLRNKPLFEQMLFVAFMLLIWELVGFAIDGWSGRELFDLARWIHIATGALLWPVIVLAFGRLHAPQ